MLVDTRCDISCGEGYEVRGGPGAPLEGCGSAGTVAPSDSTYHGWDGTAGNGWGCGASVSLRGESRLICGANTLFRANTSSGAVKSTESTMLSPNSRVGNALLDLT